MAWGSFVHNGREYYEDQHGRVQRYVRATASVFGHWEDVDDPRQSPDLLEVVKTKRLTAGELRTLADKLVAEAAQIEEATKPKYPKFPGWSMFGFSTKFGSKTYEFAVVYIPSSGFYTTGRLQENSFFETWEKLIDYIRTADEFGGIYRLAPYYGGAISSVEIQKGKGS